MDCVCDARSTRPEHGPIDMLEFLDAERTRVEVEDLCLQGLRRHAQARVALFQALAGGWPTVPVSRLPALKGARQDLESSPGLRAWRG
jgi:outer membrane protein TolC